MVYYSLGVMKLDKFIDITPSKEQIDDFQKKLKKVGTKSLESRVKNKDDKIVVRIDGLLKEQFTMYVESKGATVSDYIRQMIVQEMSQAQNKEYKGTVKDILSDYYYPELDIYKEIESLKERIMELEYRLNKVEESK